MTSVQFDGVLLLLLLLAGEEAKAVDLAVDWRRHTVSTTKG
jgi:hypothetical protein